jgi:transcriptional regulator with XRE-family HTH domain
MTGPELKARRKELGLKLKDVAHALGIKHIQQVSEWERGDVRPGRKHLAKLAEVLGLEIADLLPRIQPDLGANQ